MIDEPLIVVMLKVSVKKLLKNKQIYQLPKGGVRHGNKNPNKSHDCHDHDCGVNGMVLSGPSNSVKLGYAIGEIIFHTKKNVFIRSSIERKGFMSRQSSRVKQNIPLRSP
jgi:hypothetical protein